MILTISLWIAASVLFAITNAVSYNRGNNTGYLEGLEEGVKVKIQKIKDKHYEIDMNEFDNE